MKNGLMVLCILLLSACGEDAVAPETERRFPPIASNKFLTFVNTQASLPAGIYEVKIEHEEATTSFPYEMRVQLEFSKSTHIEPITLGGDWIPGQQRVHQLLMPMSGGLDINFNGIENARVVLTRNEQQMAPDTVADSSGQAQLYLPASKISSEQYTNAYYEAVDPGGKRKTLRGWQDANGFGNGDETYVVFRDSKDLGYGRSMFVRKRDDGGVAVYVDNYVVQLGGKSPANYGPLNVHAAVDQNLEHHVGTNAIEFSPADESDPDSPKILKFFTFDPVDESGVQHRRLAADLDGRGVKPVPTTCISCHGGALLPLDRDGKFQLQALQTAKFNQLEVNTFEFSDKPGFSLEDQQANLKWVNETIFETFSEQGAQSFVKGHWFAGFAKSLSEGRYGGEFASNTFEPNHVPEGWRQNGSRPDGVETLFKSVIEPHCISCHSLRGTVIGEATQVLDDGELISLANAVNFSSYEKFISLSERIKDYVFVRGQMPLSLRNYERFWQNPQGKPTLLASFLPGFDILDENNQVQQPSLPFAKVVAPSTLTTPAFVLGQSSVFAEQFQWRLVSKPAEADIRLGDLTAPNLLIESADAGEYELELTVTNAQGLTSEATQVAVTVSSEPVELLTFVADIKPIMGTSDNTSCSECHRVDSEYPEIPAYYADSHPDQYYDVLARIDFADPTNSPILIKPTSKQHGGSIRFDLDTESGREQYQTLLNWILMGAPCGDDDSVCH